MSKVDYLNHFSLVNKFSKLDVFLMSVNDKIQVVLYIEDNLSGEVNFFTLKDENLSNFIKCMMILDIY